MTFQEFLNGVGISEATFWTIIVFLASVFIDWRPEIKWNPWRSLIKWIGSNFNTQLDTKLDAVRGEIKALDSKIDYVQDELSKHMSESELKALEETRHDILDFCNACMNGKKHTKENWKFMMKQCDKYETYIQEKNITNGEISDAIEELHRLHKECLRTNSFLKEGEDPAKQMRDSILEDVIQELHKIQEAKKRKPRTSAKTTAQAAEIKDKGENNHE